MSLGRVDGLAAGRRHPDRGVSAPSQQEGRPRPLGRWDVPVQTAHLLATSAVAVFTTVFDGWAGDADADFRTMVGGLANDFALAVRSHDTDAHRAHADHTSTTSERRAQ